MKAIAFRVLCMKILRLVLALGVVGVAVGATAGAAGQTAPSAGPAMVRPQFAILDTDIGDDIDDAFALALALKSSEIRLLGITTAYGDTDLRAKLLDRYLGADCRGGSIPVIPGAPTPHTNVFTQAAYARGEDVTACLHNQMIDVKEEARLVRERQHHDAAGFLLRQIREDPGEITLISIGPLNNIDAAI